MTTIRRLQIAHLLFGMMFWYGIEQLFLNKYLGTSSARGYLTIAFTVSLILFDIPGGILADKFGRKKALLLACVAQIIGLVILGSSNSLTQYLIGSLVFGLFISLLDGAAQALLYDHLQLNRMAIGYGKQQGTMYALFLIGAGIANLASGFIAHALGLRAPFYLSIIPSILAFILLLPIDEPPLTKLASKWYVHLQSVFGEIKSRPGILLFGIQFVVSEIILLTIGEFGQIYILSFGVGTVALGILWAIDALFAAGGRFWAHRIQSRPTLAVAIYCVAILVFVAVRSPLLGILMFWIVYGCNEALSNVAETNIQHETKSSMRATLFSSVSFFGNILAVPIIFAFNRLYVTHSIYAANTAVGVAGVGVLIVSVLFGAKHLPKLKPKPKAIRNESVEP
jgi:MFS family permease